MVGEAKVIGMFDIANMVGGFKSVSDDSSELGKSVFFGSIKILKKSEGVGLVSL
jgi:hypothetical protein